MSNNKTKAATNRIAIVGMACRFPGGVASLEDYWSVLSEGKDVVTEIGEDRFGASFYQHPKRKEPGKSVTFAAGVLDDVEHFDADFFGISPREAAQLDPQQRLLLELSWEALENGGQVPEQLSGSDCAVYVGIASTDYLNRRVDDPASMDAYTMTGNTASVASNRISYIYNLHGPSVSVDTACSSSLVAIHHACQAIRSGESSMAIAGGVNMLLHPFAFVGFSQASMLSERGRCRTFDASGDGYVRAEGAAILFLKPLEQAEADGDPIHGVILASGINADGQTNGITVPCFDQQGNLLRKIYQQADVDINNLVYLEAHGTGTAVGDPIETKAIGEVLGQARNTEKPLLIGSAKSNLGHLETASGMAGLFKAVLTLEKQQIPPSLHIETLNPAIDFDNWNLQVVRELTPIEHPGQQQLIGINSFGFGGANAHVLIEKYNPGRDAASALDQPVATDTATVGSEDSSMFAPPLFLSAHSASALQEMAAQYADLLGESTDARHWYDLTWSASQHRQHLQQGLVLYAQDNQQARQQLENYAQGEKTQQLSTGEMLEAGAPLALLFSGNGSQWQGMGQVLLEHNAPFRKAVQEVSTLFAEHAGYRLEDEFAAAADASRLNLTEVAQPLLFAYQVGVVSVLEQLGVRPTAVVGHSVGEVAAAWACGALSLEQAVSVIYERSQAQGETAGQGRMAAVGLGLEAITERLADLALHERVEIAGVNSPDSVTVSAELHDLEALGGALEQDGVFYRILDLNYAFHSHWMEPTRDDLLAALDGLAPVGMDKGMRFISTVEGREVAASSLGAQYWWDNIRQPVAFGEAINALIDDGVGVFLEVGPHAILRNYVNECLRAKDGKGQVLASGLRNKEQADTLEQAAYSTWLAGCQLDWQAHFPTPGNFIPLPNYPWQRERYWYPLTTDGYDLVNRYREHPILGYRLKDAEATWENQLDAQVISFLADHIVDGAVVVPGAAYVEMSLTASTLWYKTASHTIENFEIRAPIVLDDSHAKSVRFKLEPADGSFVISSRERLSEDSWTVNVVGRITGAALKTPDAISFAGLDALQSSADEVLDAGQHYELTEQVGLSYLPAFQAVTQVWASDDKALARLQIPEVAAAGSDAYLLHPVLLDGAFQVLVDVFRDAIRAGRLTALIPIQIGQLNLFARHGSYDYVQVQVLKQSPRSVVADFLFLDQSGQITAELRGGRFRGVQFNRGHNKTPALYQFVPVLQPLAALQAVTPELDQASLASTVQDMLLGREDELCRAKHYRQVSPLLDVLTIRYAWDAISGLQCLLDDAGGLHSQNLLEQELIQSEYAALLDYLFELLAEEDLATQDEAGSWELAADSGLPEAHDIWLAILGDSPVHVPELVLLGRCGENLLAVMQGKVAADALLAPAKSSIHEHWQDSAPTFRAVNLMMTAWVKTATMSWPQQQRLRILEIGGNNGALSHRLVPVLPQDRCDYVFTDAQEEKVEQANTEFEDYACFSAVCVPELDEAQLRELSAGGRFDIILLGDALFDWVDTEKQLQRFRQLLKHQGVLLLANTAPNRFLDLTCGLKPDWWMALQDEQGANHTTSRLLAEAEWDDVLQKSGFTGVRHCFEPADSLEQGVFLTVATAGALASDEVLTTASDTNPVQQQSWLIQCDAEGFSAELASSLQQLLAAQQQFVKLGTTCRTEPAKDYDHIIHLAGLTLQSGNDPMAIQERRCYETLEQVQQLDKQGNQPYLWLVTAGAVTNWSASQIIDNATTEALYQPEQAPLWGLGRVLMNEHPELNCTLIDLQQSMSPEQAATQLLHECLHNDGENEVLLGQSARYVARMRQTAMHAADATAQEQTAVCLDFTSPGPLKHLYWRALPEQSLQDDEIEIRPRAAGLNFRDVMYAMGLLSDEAVENGFAGAALGMELSGTVVRTGAAVSEFQAGDAVIGFAPACFSTRVITRTTAVAHKPDDWTDQEAATIPTTFFTVYYALHHLAQLEEGDRVLIHGASGGVGLAAIQFARFRGAEVFATAGTDEKRDFVRLMGADHVMDSRSLNFAEEVMQLTGGEGVDIVLNSISGEAINKNLAILRPFGRFLELGKRDFYENSKIGLRPFRNNISYFGIDADQLLIERPKLAGRLFREMMALFADKALRPLPHRVFSARRIQEAFRYMQQSRQIGKVIVSFDGEPIQPTFPETPKAELILDAQGSYLVTGGLSGFGLRTAHWLVEKGAKHLVLLSRSGAASETAQQAVCELEGQGVNVATYACDVADQTALSGVMAEIQEKLPPLKGLVHAAMVLEDGIVRNLDRERFAKVLAPKVLGAWHLHALTQGMQLDFFVMYSSVTTYLGNPGQANYVAANMYLESLAAQRRAQGLPAVFAAWGALDDTGYLARNAEIKDALQSRLGGSPLTSQQALDVLEQLVFSDLNGAAVINMDWNTVQRVMPGARAPKYADLRRSAGSADDGDQVEDIASLIAGLEPEAVQELVADMLMAEVGDILRLPKEKLTADKSVFDLGMDSLMGMELVLAIEERFGVKLPVMALTEGATVGRIAEKITAQLVSSDDDVLGNAEEMRKQSIAKVVQQHGSDMSEEQLEQLAADLSKNT